MKCVGQYGTRPHADCRAVNKVLKMLLDEADDLCLKKVATDSLLTGLIPSRYPQIIKYEFKKLEWLRGLRRKNDER